MMATVINSLILQNSIERKGIVTRVLSALKIENVCESYIRRKAHIEHIEKSKLHYFCSDFRQSILQLTQQRLLELQK